ncbi:Nse1 non-SMC component of SMC5-6 complex-domain-containing protein [Blakeslea trispora]|nr:Nse1 non-SMC component of SMC5-6 complex-domain-containing protein [Blakeslea trispora]
MAQLEYNDNHRLFVQAMLSKQIITESEAKRLYQEILRITKIDPTANYPEFVATINKELEELDYSLHLSHDERDGEPYLTCINVKQDPMTELATPFTPKELAYIRELLNEIVHAEDEAFVIRMMEAVRLGQKVQAASLTQKETQDLLDQLVADRWIGLEDDVYYIDTRGLAELQGYLREQYGEVIKECKVCLDIVTRGQVCQNADCPIRMHHFCAETQFRNANPPMCPECQTRWSSTHVFGRE